MRPLRIATLAVLLLPGAAGAAPDLSLDAGAGGTYETNASHSPVAETPTPAWAATAFATVDLSANLGRDFMLFVAAGYGGTYLPTVPDLTAHVPSVGVRGVWLLGDRFRIGVAPWIGYRFSGDPARSGLSVAARADASVVVARWLEIAVHYRRGDTFARDDTFSSHGDAAGVTLRLYLGRLVTLRVGYQGEIGEDLTYVPVVAGQGGPTSGAGTSGQGSSRPVTTFGTNETAVRLPATFHTARAALTWRATGRLTIDAFYTYVQVVSDRPYADQLAGAGIAWRF